MNHVPTSFRSGIALAAIAVAMIALLFMRGESSATSFNPTATASLSTSAAGGHPDIAGTFNIPSPDANFQNMGVITFTPPQFGIGACPANNPGAANRTCADLSVPDGAYDGHLDSQSTLGLLNNPCNVLTPVPFDMMDASTDTSSTVTFTDGPDADTVGEQFEDDNGDGIPNGAQKYPDYLTRLVTGAAPIQRLYGQVVVSNTNIGLNFLVFAPGVTINGQFMDPSLGFPSLSILQNTGDAQADPEVPTITDFCTSLQVNLTSYGTTHDNPNTSANEAGAILRTNPSAGGYDFVTYALSQPDSDNDGIENALDTCPTSGNPDGWNPRGSSASGDSDADGIANACDPATTLPADPFYGDEDHDGFDNRGDNCPTVANAKDGNGVLHGPNNQADQDNDGIGDACDAHPATVDGHQHEVCVASHVTVTGAASIQAITAPPCGDVPTTPTPIGQTQTPTPAPGTVTPTPQPGTVTPTPQPGTVTPTVHPGTVTPTPHPGTVTPTVHPGTVTPTPHPGTVTPTPGPGTVTATPGPGTVTPTPGQTNAPGQKTWGDGDCNGNISTRDNQALLRNVLGQNPLSQTEPCPDIGQAASSHMWGDWDCNGSISARDNQALLRFVLNQPALSQTEPCADIGTPETVS